MKMLEAWRGDPLLNEMLESVEWVEGRKGFPTLRVRGVLLHSQYNPVEEARRFVSGLELSAERPVLLLGVGLGYHVAALREAGYEVACVEPNPAVLRYALERISNTESETDITKVPVATGDPDDLQSDALFQAFAEKMPSLVVHPATAQLYPVYVEKITGILSQLSLTGKRLHIAIVGPMYGGSLPIARYLVRAFEQLGHQVLFVDNCKAWPLYETMSKSIQSKRVGKQLSELASHFLSEWSYARVMEFAPDLCITMAQAPVSNTFTARLRQSGILTAFWYVENWRHFPYWKDIAPLYDAFFHIQPGVFEEQLDVAGCTHHAFIQTGCDPGIHHPVTLTEKEESVYRCDVSFAGAGYTNRIALFKGLTGIDFKIWGVNWVDRDLSRNATIHEGWFDTDTYLKIAAGSKINLNLHSSAHHYGVDPTCDALNPRVFEIAAAGGFQLCDPCIGLEQYFDTETEIPVYRSLDELREKINWYLSHEDERIEAARLAHERAINEHTYIARAQSMLDFILRNHGDKLLKKGLRIQKTVGEVVDSLDTDNTLVTWLKGLPSNVLFTHEALKPYIQSSGFGHTRAEAIFAYMTEVRQFSESLLKDRL